MPTTMQQIFSHNQATKYYQYCLLEAPYSKRKCIIYYSFKTYIQYIHMYGTKWILQSNIFSGEEHWGSSEDILFRILKVVLFKLFYKEHQRCQKLFYLIAMYSNSYINYPWLIVTCNCMYTIQYTNTVHYIASSNPTKTKHVHLVCTLGHTCIYCKVPRGKQLFNSQDATLKIMVKTL